MDDNMTVLPSREVTPAKPSVKRILAALMRKAGRSELVIDAMERKLRHDEYLAIMIWDALVSGEMLFADGRMLKLDDFKDWMDLLKFVSTHVDGPVTQNEMLNQLNVYKIYMGIDESKV